MLSCLRFRDSTRMLDHFVQCCQQTPCWRARDGWTWVYAERKMLFSSVLGAVSCSCLVVVIRHASLECLVIEVGMPWDLMCDLFDESSHLSFPVEPDQRHGWRSQACKAEERKTYLVGRCAVDILWTVKCPHMMLRCLVHGAQSEACHTFSMASNTLSDTLTVKRPAVIPPASSCSSERVLQRQKVHSLKTSRIQNREPHAPDVWSGSDAGVSNEREHDTTP